MTRDVLMSKMIKRMIVGLAVTAFMAYANVIETGTGK